MGRRWAARRLGLALALMVVVVLAARCDGGVTSSFVRKSGKTVDMPLDSDVFRVPRGYNAPQQVHITQGDHDGTAVTVSWVTQDEPGSSTVLYGTSKSKIEFFAEGKYARYKFYNYTSGYIHHCTLRNLERDTKYYYALGIGHTLREFWFRTPPKVGPDVPYTFGLIGDLGQTFDSNRTLSHYESNPKAQALLYVGDLSYADNHPNHDNVRWDTWGRKCTPVPDQSAPVYITIGDGGNVEGLANNMTEPQPSYSAYREASFGHAILEIKNRSHAYYSWHRNQDGNAVAADSMWFSNRYWHPIDDSYT
ncbi:Purple acid phosphatase 10 [Cocos nucifera]|uniref:Purple acid phosphatase 10 n=1 Tax=Cocos nucifera TaxID=13894 RepID=A0A8K0IWJ7_COCNU|nr:Purple acid phosphatase 10 [Cocos nucifera]